MSGTDAPAGSVARESPDHMRIYRALPSTEWAVAEASGAISPVDLRAGGFVHCSTAEQLPATVDSQFSDTADLVVVEIAVEELEAEVRWEDADDRPEAGPFPHVHGPIPVAAVTEATGWDDWRAVHPDGGANSADAG